jgi:hypothetical protein
MSETTVERNGVQYEFEMQGFRASLRGADGSFSGWNLEHWFQVKEMREKQGVKLPSKAVQHPLVGKTMVDTTTGQRYVVEKVVRNWWFGTFLVAVLNANGSHRTCHVENVDCVNPIISAQIRKFQKEFRVA